ncbi:MAG TPA: threonine--tRNA ligase [Gemmatimonadota bacterium]|nr:threonine--tRNA ligase [Gemmatimonadota bacterium]
MSENGTIKVRLPDGSELEAPRGASLGEIAERIGPRLAKAAYAAAIDGRVVDLSRRIQSDAAIRILTERDPETLGLYRHSTAHLMAQAVQRLWPDTKVTIGPVIEDGFFYDFEREEPFTPEDFPAIESEMDRIVMEDHPIVREEVSREDALALFRELGEPYKVEIIEDLPEGETLTIYRQGNWLDLCRGPHVPSTGRLGTYKLLSTAGAYWRGDERNRMLTRIYGTAFFKRGDLDAHLARIEEAKRRDHRKLGKELDLFSFHPNAPASPYFHPKGAWIYNRLQRFMRELYADGWPHDEIVTPQIYDVELWHISGHYENYKEHMFFTGVDEREMAVKPMNCPASTYVYAAQKRSYRDLPIRYADFGRLHRYEKSGVVTGLFRVRTFVQDDAHIFCRPDQIQDEVTSLIRLVQYVMEEVFGFTVGIELSLRGDKRIGSDAAWDVAEDALRQALVANGLAFREVAGEGAFYGPKIDFQVTDALGRKWQLSTIQCDFNLPERFGLHYTTPEGTEERPVVIHRAILGSIERFMGILVEHYGGAFPTWLAPEQVRIVPVSDTYNEYAQTVAEHLGRASLRAHVDERREGVGYKIRDAEMHKIPYMLVVGEKEVGSSKVSVRSHSGGELGQMDLDHFVSRLRDEADPPAPRRADPGGS